MVLLALLVGLVAVLAAAIFVGVRGVGLWRQAKRTSGTITRELSSFEERAARAERNLAEWERASADLEAAVKRLRISRARLQVLLDALERAQGRTRWLRVFLPV
ncbi:MAG TPA: hypothetical protein VIG93_09065 [Gaiellaceae bacterium]